MKHTVDFGGLLQRNHRIRIRNLAENLFGEGLQLQEKGKYRVQIIKNLQ